MEDYNAFVKQNLKMDAPIDVGSVNDALGLAFTCNFCGENDWLLVKKNIQVNTFQCKKCAHRQHFLKWG